MKMPRSFRRDGTKYDRVTVVFRGGRLATTARAVAGDAFLRAHGYRATRGLTDALARSGGRFRSAVARSKVRSFVARMSFLVAAGLVALFVGGRRVA